MLKHLAFSSLPAPDHLVSLAGRWSLWRWVCLRGAGFPAAGVLRLSSPTLVGQIDVVLGLEDAAEKARQHACACCTLALQNAGAAARARLKKVLKRLRSGVPVPGDPDAGAEANQALRGFEKAHAELAAARRTLSDSFAEERSRVSGVMREVARAEPFREALTWQNRGALRRGIEALLRRPEGAAIDSDTRHNEWLVASYLQRYSVKNDTIGFFGPVGWARFVDQGEPIVVRPGPSLLAKRTVYHEHWGIELLAARIAEDPAVKVDLSPRRMPTVCVEGTTLRHPIDRTSELPLEFARLLAACDGERSARAIAAGLVADPELSLESAEEVYELLAQLVDKRLATWTIEIPTVTPPELSLRQQLERVQDEAARARWLGALGELETKREAVARAAGDAAALDRALGELEETFSQHTGAAATRNEGRTYAGRTLVYEDCRRDVSVDLGPSLLARLAAPLSLVLQIARWYTHRIAALYQEVLLEAYRALRDETGSPVIDYLRFFARVQGHFTSIDAGTKEEPPAIVREVSMQLRARWIQLLAIGSEGKPVERASASLHAGVRDAFAAPHPGWPSARYHSPDILISAESIEAVREGEFLSVLGELHVGTNSVVDGTLFLSQHPDPDQLIQARERDVPPPLIEPVIDSMNARSTLRSLVSRDVHVEVGASRSWRARSQVVAIGELVVEEIDGRLMVRTRDRRSCCHAIPFFGHHLSAASLSQFGLAPEGPHSPRISIDGVVVSRERWQFAPLDLTFAHEKEALGRFIVGRRWARAQGLPRFLFYKIPEEIKPCFLDFDSPLYVEMFAKQVRKASSVFLSEMVPSIEKSWLTDSVGSRYTSELRIVAVDPEAWRP